MYTGCTMEVGLGASHRGPLGLPGIDFPWIDVDGGRFGKARISVGSLREPRFTGWLPCVTVSKTGGRPDEVRER